LGSSFMSIVSFVKFSIINLRNVFLIKVWFSFF
jgi:hypothetical protein